ncbi:hypothetical protein PVK06_003754 [Gossypium arboreum]|uniref:Uncharacterized protein n=1 Tax=Gossypium arboreum TaxID=29729 RepID=A0ABR0QRE1_GOSAR|nr:hypothetical protein PVK06_003754 [Gossypium arboreum]
MTSGFLDLIEDWGGVLYSMLNYGYSNGLIILQNKKWDKASIQTGSMEVIQSIKEMFTRPSHSALIREENMEVNRIAKLAFD